MYWPAWAWQEGHAAPGSTETGFEWALAEGIVGGPTNTETYILLANPGATAAQVSVAYLRENGLPPIEKSYTVEAASRLTIAVGWDVPALLGERFGAVATVTSGPGIMVERSLLYWDANGTVWAAGTAGRAVRLR